MTGKRNVSPLVPLLAILAACATSAADPLHRIGSNGDHRHEGSGWIYPKQVADFARTDAPYTIDGNNDVGAEYRQEAAHGSRTAVVEIYYPDSAAAGATLVTAMQAVKRAAGDGADMRPPAEELFTLPGIADLDGVRIHYVALSGSNAMQTSLYFFRSPTWTVAVRTSAPANDEGSTAAFDHFVRALRWETLGTDAGDLHAPVR